MTNLRVKVSHLMDLCHTLVEAHSVLPTIRSRVTAKRFEYMASNLRRSGIPVLLHTNWLLTKRLRAGWAHVLEVIGIHFRRP